MDKTPVWKPLLVVVSFALFVLAIYFPGSYGPKERLRLGIDLAGGTTLVYQVNVPPEQRGNAKQIVDDVISVLRSRVDPDGLRNLIWRQQAGNRIEVQMPVASPEVRVRREAYQKAEEALLAMNLSPQRLGSVLRLGAAERRAALEQIAGGDGELLMKLTRLAEAQDDLSAVTGAYQAAEQAKKSARSALDAAGQKHEAAARSAYEAAENDAIAMAGQYNAAQRRYQELEAEVLAGNVVSTKLESILQMYDPRGKREDVKKKFEQAVAEFRARHADKAEAVEAVIAAYKHYAEVKGPLDDPNDLIALLRGSGIVEFRIAMPESAIPDVQTYRTSLQENGPRYGVNLDYRWFPIDDLTQFVNDAKVIEQLSAKPEQWSAYLSSQRGLVGQAYGDKVYLLLANTPGLSITQAQQWKIISAQRSVDDKMLPAVAFQLNSSGGALMQAMSARNIRKPMAILLDGRVMTAPSINSELATNIQVSSPNGFSPREVDYLTRTLKAGSIQGSLSSDPISIQKTGPNLGQDNLQRSLRTGAWAMLAVTVFMTGYYFYPGLIAIIALVMNLLMILGVMATFHGTFTLTGIAGVVLTIGMAVDANVLVFERVREELQHGADRRTALRLGFEKAFSTILDANVTTFITCLVLYYTATADVKGFALTMMIGILGTMYTAVFCSRVMLGVSADAGIRTLRSLPMVCGPVRRALSPNINWMGLQKGFWTVSLLLIVLGAFALYERGKDMLDIEFSSGTRVTFDLRSGSSLELETARQRIREALPGVISNVVSVGSAEADGTFTGFAVQTLETDATKVSDAVKASFEDVLDIQRPIEFAGVGDLHAERSPLAGAPVYPIGSRSLGLAIGRGDVEADVSEYLGGVAVVLGDLQPSSTAAELTQRIERMRRSPLYEDVGFRDFKVIGVDLDPAAPQRYRSAVVVVRDEQYNYVQNPESLTEEGGLADTEWRLVRDAMIRDTSLGSVSKFDSQVSATMRSKAIQAMVISLFCVGLYIWVRFGSLRYGLGAIVALVHDVTIAMGFVAMSGFVADTAVGRALGIETFRVDLALIASMLTLVGYSLNDTIVVFDRIRENRGRLSTVTGTIVNNSINQTISRTVLTSFTTFLSLLVMYSFGGSGIKGFAFAMLVGVVVGTYSSIAIASPMLLLFAPDAGGPEAKKGEASEVLAAR
ncbi:MAG: protein translocase subunit SecD [Phycisphaeraceae bacterium]|nr:protein translocase subunit SecD [Phycisphaeraceae bacterium]